MRTVPPSSGCLLLLSAVAAGVGCESLDRPTADLPPAAAERLRDLLRKVEDPRLQRDLAAGLDRVQAEWPNRRPADDGIERATTAADPTPVEDLRRSVRGIPDAKLRAKVEAELDDLSDAWIHGARDKGRPPGWFLHPAKVRVDSFTRLSKTEEGRGYLEARVQVLDKDGHPMRAIGKFRIELFAFQRQAPDPRGDRLAVWNIDIQDHEDNRRYFDVLINGYTFPLEMPVNAPADASGKYVVEATFIRPDGRRVFPSNYRYLDSPDAPDDKKTTPDDGDDGLFGKPADPGRNPLNPGNPANPANPGTGNNSGRF